MKVPIVEVEERPHVNNTMENGFDGRSPNAYWRSYIFSTGVVTRAV